LRFFRGTILPMTLTYRWLGAAGLELAADGFVLLVDPFFTRPGRAAMVLGARVAPDERLAERYAPRADAVLVTHPHYDHLMDVPGILRRTGARAYGSPNTRALLGWRGIPAEQARQVSAGDHFQVGPFEVEALRGYHRPVPLARVWNGPLPRGGRRLPLRLSDYRMDACYCFRIRLGELTLLVGNPLEPVSGTAQVVFLAPYQPADMLARALEAAQPWLVVPIHWDDFNRPLDRPLRPMRVTSGEGEGHFPPLRPVDLSAFARVVHATAPDAVMQAPVLFQPVRLDPA
jgi:L-ascorbate metabolism protein UlaG (beta-lactamase superfamily)